MNRTWSFTDLEFVARWEALGQDCLPEPLIFTSRTPLYDDYVREKSDIMQRLRSERDRSFDGVLEAVAGADIRVSVCGWDERDRENPAGSVRVHAARQGDNAYVLTQAPGETIHHSAGFTVVECAVPDMASLLVAQIPQVPAGKMSEVVLVTVGGSTDTDYSYGSSPVRGSFDDTVAQGSAKFLDSAATSVGTIEVTQGRSKFGPRGITRHRFMWRDVEGDGRYAITFETPPVAMPADAKRLTTMINADIAKVVRALKDEGL